MTSLLIFEALLFSLFMQRLVAEAPPARPDASGRFAIPLQRQLVPVLGASNNVVSYKSVYYGTVSIGAPMQEFSLLFDTGSGHVVVPSSECTSPTCLHHRRYSKEASSTAVDIDADGSEVLPGEARDQMTVAFGTGEITGQFVRDTMCFNLAAPRPSAARSPPPSSGALRSTAAAAAAAVAAAAVGKEGVNGSESVNCVDLHVVTATDMTHDPFHAFPFDGILGLGLDSLAVAPEFSFFDMLLRHRQLAHPSFGVYLADEREQALGGVLSEISFGGPAPEKMQSALSWVPVALPELGHWLVNITRLRLSGRSVDFCDDGQCRAVVDTGTSVLAVPQDFAEDLDQALDSSLRDPEPFSEERGCGDAQGVTIYFDLENGVTLELGPADYSRSSMDLKAYERVQDGGAAGTAALGESADGRASSDKAAEPTGPRCRAALMPLEMAAPLGPKLFIWGEPILRKYYTAFNWRDKQVGFSLAAHGAHNVGNPASAKAAHDSVAVLV